MKYCINIKDFEKVVKPGNYILNYAIFDDRIHLEYITESVTFSSQKFLETLKEELMHKADNYTGSMIKIYLDDKYHGITSYRFYPTEDEIKEMKKIKLYEFLEVEKSEKIHSDTKLQNFEYDDKIISRDNKGKTILITRKVTKHGN